MTAMPPLETGRLRVGPLSPDDLPAVHQLLDLDLAEADFGSQGAQTLEARREWLEWTILSYAQYAALFQPPYGERAIILKDTEALIGLCGFVPCLNSFEQLPGLSPFTARRAPAPHTAEVGLYYAVAPAHQRRGYAAEAAGAMSDYAFQHLRLKRLVATTTRDNAGSIGVMRKLGMRVVSNPHPEPPWLQVVGVLDHAGPAADPIRWRLHLASPPQSVYNLLATDDGRARFWAESAVEGAGSLDFVFPGGQTWRGRILAAEPPRLYRVEYYGGSLTTFLLEDDGQGGTDLTLTDEGVPEADRAEVLAGWVSVLMALKAAADFGADLRNHDPERSWDQGFADN